MEFSCIVFLFSLLTNACFITKTRPDLIPDLGMGRALVQKETAKLLSIGNADALGGWEGGGGGVMSAFCVRAGKGGMEKRGRSMKSTRIQSDVSARLGAAGWAQQLTLWGFSTAHRGDVALSPV